MTESVFSPLAWELARYARFRTTGEDVRAELEMGDGDLMVGRGQTTDEALTDLAVRIDGWCERVFGVVYTEQAPDPSAMSMLWEILLASGGDVSDYADETRTPQGREAGRVEFIRRGTAAEVLEAVRQLRRDLLGP